MIHEIKHVAMEIDSQFDYSNTISFGGNYLKDAYGIEFANQFTEFFSNEWHGALGEAIMDIDVEDLISRAVRHAFVSCDMKHVDSGNYMVN
jgi:hypothetical protein